MQKRKMSAEEMADYYKEVHRNALARNCHDRLNAVIHPGDTRWVNRFTNFAHRLGMKQTFAYLESQGWSLPGRSVLDVGCGRGRWSKEYASRGALVTGVDISPEAIVFLAREMPGHRFVCGDVTAMEFASETFDLINSVTVMQHLPENKQEATVDLASGWLKPGGWFVLMENVADFDAPHVYPHQAEEWIDMVEATGLRCTAHWGSNFELLPRLAARTWPWTRKDETGQMAATPPARPDGPTSLKRQVKDCLKATVALLSFPAEWLCHKFPLARASHSVMMFRKR